MHQAVRGATVGAVETPAVAPPRTESALSAAERVVPRPEERLERRGLSKDEIERGTRGAATVHADGTILLALTVPATVSLGFGLSGRKTKTIASVTFHPLPAGFQPPCRERLLGVFASSIRQPVKIAKGIFTQLTARDVRHVQALIGHVLMVCGGGRDAERGELLALFNDTNE